jgi:hypothetical protein
METKMKRLWLLAAIVVASVAVSRAQKPIDPVTLCNTGRAINATQYELHWNEWSKAPGLYSCSMGKGPTPSEFFRFQIDGTEDTVDSFDVETSFVNLAVGKANMAENLHPLLRALFAVVAAPVPADLLKAIETLKPGRFMTTLGPVNTVYKTGADVRPYTAEYIVHFTQVP